MYQANIYKDAVIIKRVTANSVELLKDKCEPYISSEDVTSIQVVELSNIGYLKLPKEFVDIIEKELIL